MQFRDAIKAVFGGLKQRVVGYWREIGGYTATFSPYTGQIYANETCRACIRKLAEDTARANARVSGGDKRLENLLNVRPNIYMSGKDFLYKCRTLYEIYNTAFIYINRDDSGRAISLYPIPNCQSEAVESGDELYIRFWLPNGKALIAAWGDLAVLRKDFHSSDIYGDANTAISTSLDLLQTTNQGMANAIKSTANLRGLLKSSKAMLSDDDVKAAKDRFVANYMGMDNTSGIGMMDSTLTFTPVTMQPVVANYKSVEELRNNIYRYFGMSEEAVMNKLTGDAAEAFYEGAIEPFLVALSLELTYKIYTDRQRVSGKEITYEANRMQFMTFANKLQLTGLWDRGVMNANQIAEAFNLSPPPGGDQYHLWQEPKQKEQDPPILQDGSDNNANQN